MADPIRQGELYAGYAQDSSIREAASSGGIVSAALIELLSSGHKAALVSGITSRDGFVRAVTWPARSRQDVLAAAGSSYVDTPVLRTLCRLADEPGPMAVVALPCQIRALRRLQQRRPELKEKFHPVIGLFCRKNVTTTFYDDFLRRCGVDPGQVESIKIAHGYLKGGWYRRLCDGVARGPVNAHVRVRLRDGTERRLSFSFLNAYRTVGAHAKTLCAFCHEHLAEQADLSVGDIFMKPYRSRPIKHSAFIARTAEGVALVQKMIEGGSIAAEHVGMDRYRKAFGGLVRFSDRLDSRRLAAALVGRSAPKGLTWRTNVFHMLAWTVLFANERLSRTRWGRRLLFALPRPVVMLTALAVKGLSHL